MNKALWVIFTFTFLFSGYELSPNDDDDKKVTKPVVTRPVVTITGKFRSRNSIAYGLSTTGQKSGNGTPDKKM